MAFNVNELNVIRSYIAVTGSAPTQDQLAAAFNFSSLNALTRELTLGNTQSNEDFVKALYTNLLGREADAAGLEYWTSLMSSSQGLNALSKAAVTTAFQWAAAANAANEPTLVDGTAGLSPVGGAFPVGGGDEEEPGTGEPGVEYQDTFTFDTEIGRSDVAGWSHIKGDANEAAVGVAAPVGAERADYESKTHKIFNIGKEAIDKGINTISADYTFKVSNQLGDQGKYEGYFLSPILDNTTTNLGAVLTLEVIDRMAEANNKADALSLVAIESFSFYLNGEQKVIGSQAILNATTYEELRDAIAAELTAQGLTNVSVTLGSDFTRQQVDVNTLDTTGANVLGTQIILTASGNSVIERGGFAFGERAGVDRNVDPSGRQDTSALGSTTSLISTNIELQNVGYGSQGGSINISGQSESKTGVEEFNVKANAHGNTGLGVWLTELSSNPLKDAEQNALKVVNVTGGAKYFHVGAEQAAALRNNDGAVKAGKDNAGLTDVRLFNAAQFAGNVKVNAQITDKVIARDLNLVDTQGNPAADNVTYTYNTGSGNDQLILSVSQSVIQHEDARLSINTGAGNDYVHLRLDNDDNAPAHWLTNQQALNNIIVNGGSGNNTIWTEGAGRANITTGGGNDTIYTDNDGSKFVAGAAPNYNLGLTVDQFNGLANSNGQVHAHWVFNNNAAVDNNSIFSLAGAANQVIGFMPKAALQVTFAGATGAGSVTNPAAGFNTNGFEVEVEIPTGPNFVVTRAHLNQAVKKAINEDAVLSKLLVAKDGPNNTLIIESKIDGEFVANDLQFNVVNKATDFTTLTTAEQQQITSAWQALNKNSGETLAGAQAANAAQVATANGVNPTLASTAGNAGTAHSFSFDVTGANLAATDTLSFGTAAAFFTAAGPLNDAALATALNGQTFTIGTVDYTVSATGNVVTFTSTTSVVGAAIDPVQANDVAGDPSFLNVTFGSITLVAPGTAATTVDITGSNSAADNEGNTVNAGAGNDVIVLSSEGASSETIVFTGSSIGNNTIVNFTNAGGAAAGQDKLDFSAYLTALTTAVGSTSTVSQSVAPAVVVDGVVGGTTLNNANSVVVFNGFAQSGTAATNDLQDWAGLNAQNFLAAIQNQTTSAQGWGNLANASLEVGAPANLVNNTIKAIVLVENDLNNGQYKVFEVTGRTSATAAENDFTGATLLGTVDFGNTIASTSLELA